jgi:hypothetical protein
VNLDIAAKILIGDANIDRSDYSKFKSKYNVAVLTMITGPQTQD